MNRWHFQHTAKKSWIKSLLLFALKFRRPAWPLYRFFNSLVNSPKRIMETSRRNPAAFNEFNNDFFSGSKNLFVNWSHYSNLWDSTSMILFAFLILTLFLFNDIKSLTETKPHVKDFPFPYNFIYRPLELMAVWHRLAYSLWIHWLKENQPQEYVSHEKVTCKKFRI